MLSARPKTVNKAINQIKTISHLSTSIIVLALLLYTVIAGTGESIHSRLLSLGTNIWDDYTILRTDAVLPSCNPSINIDNRLQELERAFNSNDDDFDLFEETFDREASRRSLKNQQSICIEQHAAYQTNIDNTDLYVITFRAFERSFAAVSLFAINQQHVVLVLLLLLSAGIATIQRHHISFRSITTQSDHRISTISQLIANSGLCISAWSFHQGSINAGIEVTNADVNQLLIVGTAMLALINLYQLVTPPKNLEPGGSPLKAILSIPIYTFMLLAAINHFFISEGHIPGIAIYFTQLFQLTGLYLHIALYIWVGMLLKQTRLGERIFDIFKPWRLPPEILAFVAIVVMAVPTAYTGASGIIIIAMGVVVYSELRRVGTRRQLALAVTAMTGSSGVVLRPCLLVVGIAMLNKEVVTDDLFHWGGRVFMLTLLVFLFYAILTKKDPIRMTPIREALGPSLRNFIPLAPYAGVITIIIAAYSMLLNAHLDEFSAPIILPVLVIALIIYERVLNKPNSSSDSPKGATVKGAIHESINGSSVHIGALLMVMACSFAVGGILEQGGTGFDSPGSFSSPITTMIFLVVFLVFIGMIMDPFGALILVTSTAAPLAYNNGINPIHFWMTCLVAFELGYLSPPVSLNHLLTRQAVGAEEIELASLEGGNSFYYRHERFILPLLVMSTTLILVAFGPLVI